MGTFSDNLLLSILAYGESTANGFDNWGESANFNFSRLDAKLGNKSTVSLTAGDVTLSAAAEASLCLEMTGTLSADRTVNISTRPGFWMVMNEATGGFDVTITPQGGDGVVVPQGSSIIYSDGSAARIVSGRKVGFLANKNNTNQTKDINSNLDKVTFTNEVFDEGGYYDAAESKWTPPAGRYQITVQAGIRIGTGYRTAFVLLYKNGALHRKSPGNWSDTDNADLLDQISVPIEANGTDYFEVYVAVDAISGTIIPGDIQRVWFSGHAI